MKSEEGCIYKSLAAQTISDRACGLTFYFPIHRIVCSKYILRNIPSVKNAAGCDLIGDCPLTSPLNPSPLPRHDQSFDLHSPEHCMAPGPNPQKPSLIHILQHLRLPHNDVRGSLLAPHSCLYLCGIISGRNGHCLNLYIRVIFTVTLRKLFQVVCQSPCN